MIPSSTPWWDFGYFGIFACVFLEQIGIPLPAFPALIGAGALIISGELNLPGCLITALAAALMADLIWYSVGRKQGGAVLGLMCRLSWRPDSCVNKTKTAFADYGPKTLLFSKFIPGLSVLATPLAGMTRVPLYRFIIYDSVGTVVWAMAPLLAGLYLQHSIVSMQMNLNSVVSYLPWVCGSLIVGVLAWRYFRRRQYLKNLEASLKKAVSPVDLKTLIASGQDVVIVDVRAQMDLAAKPFTLPQALWIPYPEVPKRLAEIGLGKCIVPYCDCPRDQTAVAVTKVLIQHGAKDVRPLHGGLDAWIEKGFPTVELVLV